MFTQNPTMEEIRQFLDQSTIHGLSHLSTGRKWSRLLWMLVVIGGFTGAVLLIQKSFYNWDESPISTTLETLPITQITLPNVTVCPPKTFLLTQNFDMTLSNEMKIEEGNRKKLLEFAFDLIQEKNFSEMIRNLGKLEIYDRFYNWYHGYTKIEYPYLNLLSQLRYIVHTSLASGIASTQHFGDNYNESLVDSIIDFGITVYVPENLPYGNNVTLTFKIVRNTLNENGTSSSSYFRDTLNFLCSFGCNSFDRNIISKTYEKNIISPKPGDKFLIQYKRNIPQSSIKSTEDNKGCLLK